MKARVLTVALIVALLAAVGGGIWWYVSVPHTPEAQFDYAQKLETAVRGDAVTATPAAIKPRVEEVIEQYRRVTSRFGKNAKTPEAIQRIADVQETLENDSDAAMGTLDELKKDYPDEDHAGFALREQARMLHAQADGLKRDGKPGDEKYKLALSKLDEYRKAFEKGKDADWALMEIGRIHQDGLASAPEHVLDTFEKFLKDYPQSQYRPEAMWRLGNEYEWVKESKKALALYAQLLEEFPKDPKYAPMALDRQGKLLADAAQHDEAAKAFEKLQSEFPDTPQGSSAGGQARTERNAAAEDESKKYGQSRYGGSLPYDTTADKPVPPAALVAEFARQKLDAREYDLNVELLPKDHRITVNGTLKLGNLGEDKTDILLMLGRGLEFSTLTVDGVAAKIARQAEAVKITMPALFKKDAEVTLAFAYSGQYADQAEVMKAMEEAMKASTKPGAAAMEAATKPAAASREALSRIPMADQISLGEYGYALSGAAWYPITIIGDVFNAHVTLKTPANMEAVTNGAVIRREKSTTEGTEGVFEFQTKSPVFGLYFAYGPYVVQDKQVGDIHYYTYLKPANAFKSDAYVATTDKILSFYGSKFGGFPYEKMAMIETPLPPILGGVGPASMMLLQTTFVDRRDVPETLLAHELAHQWFGNLIPINLTDEHYNQWLSEGFATYCDALYTEHTDGPKALALHIQKYTQFFFQLKMTMPSGTAGHGIIRDTFMNSSLYRPVIYEKGAVVLHMLRKVMGDEKFFALMKGFVETYKNKPTTVEDFTRMADKVMGEDLSWFFAEWLDQAIIAHWKVDAEVDAAGGAGGFHVKIKVTQPEDLVKMPADITLIGDKGERQVLPNQMLDKKEQMIETTSAFRPAKIVIDEDHWVLRHPGTDNIWTAEKAATQPATMTSQ